MLCVAEHGRKNDKDHQDPVYHSVIPNHVARKYDYNHIYPRGVLEDVLIDDYYCNVPITLPFDLDHGQEYFLVRHVLIKFLSDNMAHPENGSCCLSDKDYFQSSVRIFDKRWEDNDISNDVDVCLITGQQDGWYV
jgi:hypothetical protein